MREFLNSAWREIKEARTFLYFVLALFIITPIIHSFYQKLIVDSYSKEAWAQAKVRILASCSKNITLDRNSLAGNNYFDNTYPFVSFVCEGKVLHYSNFKEMPHHWGWGDILKDPDYVLARDEMFLLEIIALWEKTGDYQKEVSDYHYQTQAKEDYGNSYQKRIYQEIEQLKKGFHL